MPPTESWLALDIGGANIKSADDSGSRSTPFALWREPARLPHVLREMAGSSAPSSRIALTMTAELCDCFPTKRAGVLAVLASVSEAFPSLPTFAWCTDGRFRTGSDLDESPLLAAASNWQALATVVGPLAAPGAGLLIDVGSTTTDLIPLRDGRVIACGRTDPERLRLGSLVYAGVRRTPLCALADRLSFRGALTGVAAEWFATTHDVFVTLGQTPEDPDDLDTADRRPATVDGARDRLARMICADRESCSPDDAHALALQFRARLLDRLADAAVRWLPPGNSPFTVVVAGSGQFLAEQLAARFPRVPSRLLRLSDLWGPAASTAACAHAVLQLARQGAPGLE